MAHLLLVPRDVQVRSRTAELLCGAPSGIYTQGRLVNTVRRSSAHVPKLPGELLQEYQRRYDEPPSAAVLRYLKESLFQAVWAVLLDEEFMAAYTHGILMECADGVLRRQFLRVMLYSADYPEKCVPTWIM